MSNFKVRSSFISAVDMKNYQSLFILFLLVLSADLLKAQGERLAAFSAERLDGRNAVEVRWTLKANVSCQSPQVQRSNDKEVFTTIYTYPGVCGGAANEESYQWIDTRALNNYKFYYRLKIDDAEFSAIDSVEGDTPLSDEGVYLYPNPSSTEVFLKHEPSFGRLEVIKLYGHNGIEIPFKGGDIKILYRGFVRLNVEELAEGIYYLKCTFSEGYQRQLKLICFP